MTCSKKCYDSEGEAIAAARTIARKTRLAPRGTRAYRCQDGCKKANGQRAWHFTTVRPGVRRQR